MEWSKGGAEEENDDDDDYSDGDDKHKLTCWWRDKEDSRQEWYFCKKWFLFNSLT